MANRYGEAAILAAQQAASSGNNPQSTWDAAMYELYPTSPIARKKSAPRAAFLGLCEEGLVKSIPAGHYKASPLNKSYAVQAAALLTAAQQHWSRSALWQAVTEGATIEHDSQIDIVMALWKNDLIQPRPLAT